MKKSILFFVLAFISPITVLACSQAVQVDIVIGQLHIDDKTDADFASLSGARLSQQLVAQPTSDGCLYSTAEEGPFNALSIGAKLFLYIHESSRGESIQLNGYTDHGKMFSIRSKLAANADIPSLPITASVHDASGPAKELLGQASLLIREE